MKITFNLTNNDLKQAELMTYDRKRYYTLIKIIVSLISSLLIFFTVVLPFRDLILIFALSVLFQTSSLKTLVLLFIIFSLLLSFFCFFFIDFLIKLAIRGKYYFGETKSVPTTIMIEESALIYLNDKNRHAIPWREINGILEHEELYLLDVPYIKQYLPIKREPDALDEKEIEQFHKEIQERISK